MTTLRCEVYILPPSNSLPDKLLSDGVLHSVINLYGDPNHGEIVGVELDKSGIFLQEPIHMDKMIPYRNPHGNPHVFTICEDDTTPLFVMQHDENERAFESEISAIIHESNSFDQDIAFVQDTRVVSLLKRYDGLSHASCCLQCLTLDTAIKSPP